MRTNRKCNNSHVPLHRPKPAQTHKLVRKVTARIHLNVSMVREYHNHTLQINPRHREEEPQEHQQLQDIRKTMKVKLPALASIETT